MDDLITGINGGDAIRIWLLETSLATTAIRFEFQIGGALADYTRPSASVFDGAVPSSRSVDSQMHH